MSNEVYVMFKREETYNVNGELLMDYWMAKVFDDHTVHDFDYETFEELREHWRPENVIQNLREFDVLEDFVETLRYQKGFYYPSEELLSRFIEIDLEVLDQESSDSEF